MTVRADLIIVGAGLAGASAAYAAARRGRSVVVLEQFGPGHRNGSSHGSARIFRRAYPDPLYVRLTGDAFGRWRQLEDESGEPLLTLTGGLDFGPDREKKFVAPPGNARGIAFHQTIFVGHARVVVVQQCLEPGIHSVLPFQ